LGQPSLLFGGYRNSFPKVKRPKPEVNCSFLFHANFKNELSYASASPSCLPAVDRDSFNILQPVQQNELSVVIFELPMMVREIRVSVLPLKWSGDCDKVLRTVP